MSIFGQIRERIGAVIAAVAGAVCLLAVGALLAFVISPQQAVEWRRIQNLPQIGASDFTALAPGAEVAITGNLQGNSALTADGFVAYEVEQWDVSTPESSSDSSSGSWNSVETNIPVLTIALSDGTIATTASSSASMSGNLHEVINEASGSDTASYNGRDLADGSRKTSGFFDGDLITVVGQKGSSGDLVPDRLFGGDRVALVDYIRSGAKAAFIGGIAMMICSPIVLIGGVLAAIFGRKRGGIKL